MSAVVSVTEVRNALRCPRIFVLGRQRGAPLAFPVGSSCLGAAFHRIVERFAGAVASAPDALAALPAGATGAQVTDALEGWLLGMLVDELQADPSYATMPAEVDDLAEALRELARYLAGRLASFPGAPRAALAQLVRGGEQPVEAALGRDGVLVRGRIDALYGRPGDACDVIEYKLTDEANEVLDRAQVALYRALLEGQEGLKARPVVLRFSPALRESVTEERDADALLERAVLPLLGDMARWLEEPQAAPATQRRDLCAACALVRDCVDTYPARLDVRDEPPSTAARPRPGVEGAALTSPAPVQPAARGDADEDGRREAEHVQARILETLRKQGVSAVARGAPVVGPTLYLIEVARERGPVRQLDAHAEDVKHRLATEENLTLTYENVGGRRRFSVRRTPPRKVMLAPLLEARREWLRERSGRFVLGQEPAGEVLCGDFSDAATPHLLVAGQAGSGKSVLLRSVVASLLHFHSPSAIRFTLVDPKRVTFNVAGFMAAVSAHLDAPLIHDAEEALPVLERLVDVMEERYRLFAGAGVSDLAEFNSVCAAAERLERKVVVMDEFQDLTADRSAAKPFFEAVKRLGAKARAAGVHLVLATQRPDRDTVPPIIKANLGGKVALRVASATNSRVILDVGGAELLHGHGDLLADLGHGPVRAQGALT